MTSGKRRNVTYPRQPRNPDLPRTYLQNKGCTIRRLTTIIWHMLKRQEKYRYNFEPFDEPLAHAG